MVYGGPGDDTIGFEPAIMDDAVIDKAYGGEGNDIFGVQGYYGEAFLYGGAGDDTYSFQGGFGAAKIIEKAGEGIDTIQLWYYGVGSMTLPDNVENVYIGADSSSTLTGNALDNVMASSNDYVILYGLAGNDTLTGGYNADRGNELYGGDGNDILNDGYYGSDILKTSAQPRLPKQ